MSDAVTLRRRVRADRHATSFPLIVVGAVGFHYASAAQLSWLSPLYGIPLAFVVVWALQRRTERRDGVGSGQDETLLVAFGVFMLASLFVSPAWLDLMPARLENNVVFWMLVPAAGGLAALGQRQANRGLVVAAAVIVLGCAIGEALGEWSWATDGWVISYRDLSVQLTFLAVTVAGLLAYRHERAIAES